MVISIKQTKLKILEILPLLLLFYISLSGSSVFDLKLFSINIHYILIYYWVLRRPEILGNGFIFLSGIVTDVMFGLPLGITALTLLVNSAMATYVRVVTVRVNLFSDWISFIPALLIANFIYFIALYFSNYSIDYSYLFINSVFTFLFYPILWILFTVLLNFMKN